MLSHENAVSFVDWCSEVFEPTAARPLLVTRAVSLRPLDPRHPRLPQARRDAGADRRGIGQGPQRLAQLIADERITIWYSAPSILALLAQFGNLPTHDYSALRLVLFAGEVFPVKHLRALSAAAARAALLQSLRPDRNQRLHLLRGPACRSRRTAATPYPDRQRLLASAPRVARRARREVRAWRRRASSASPGRGVMQGYWALPEQTANGFLIDADGTRWYRTGDIVTEAADGSYTYRGRRDRMVKRRGYRVELGEIEAGLYRHASRSRKRRSLPFPDEEAGVQHHGLPELPRGQASVADRDQALLRREPAALHDPGPILLARRLAQDLDRQDRLPAAQGDALMDFALHREQKMLRDRIVKFAHGELNDDVRRARSRPGLLARALAQVRRDRHAGPARARRSTVAAGSIRCPAPSRSRRWATAAATAGSCSRSARTAGLRRAACGSTAARSRSGAT